MLTAALSAKGYDTRVAHDAPATMRIAAFRTSVAFRDIGLPVMDEDELAGHLGELPVLNGMKLVALAGYGQTEISRGRVRSPSGQTS